jgi:hypothetical protein
MFPQQNSNLGKHYEVDYGVIVNNLWDTLGTWGHMVDIDGFRVLPYNIRVTLQYMVLQKN